MQLRYDATTDYAYLLIGSGRVAQCRCLPGRRRLVEYDACGRPLGILLRGLRQGVDLTGLPYADKIGALLVGFGFKVFFSSQETNGSSRSWGRGADDVA